MKQIIGLMLYLNMNAVFADVDGVISRQISGQISRATSNSISRSVDYQQREQLRQDASVPNRANNYEQYRNVLDFNETLPPPTYVPSYSYPNVDGFSR